MLYVASYTLLSGSFKIFYKSFSQYLDVPLHSFLITICNYPTVFVLFLYLVYLRRHGFAPSFVNYKKGALDSQPQVTKFNTSCPGSVVLSGYSATKTGRHDITEIFLKVALNTKNSINQSLICEQN